MGLDMYLKNRRFIGMEFSDSAVVNIVRDGVVIDINPKQLSEVILRVGYWRKANAIHAWFVRHAQDDHDDCKEHWVSFTALKSLEQTCREALEKKDPDLLPTRFGFFFGSVEIDDRYWQSLEQTVSILEKLDPDGDYYYQSSW